MVAFGTKQSLTEYLDGIIAGYGQRYGQVLWDNDITDSEVCELPFNSLCWSRDCLQHLIVHKAPMQESAPVRVHQPFCLSVPGGLSLAAQIPSPLPPPPRLDDSHAGAGEFKRGGASGAGSGQRRSRKYHQGPVCR